MEVRLLLQRLYKQMIKKRRRNAALLLCGFIDFTSILHQFAYGFY